MDPRRRQAVLACVTFALVATVALPCNAPAAGQTGSTWMSPAVARTAGLIYASGYACQCVNVYDALGHNQQVIGHIGGLQNPLSLASDQESNLYVVAGYGVILYFPKGALKPTKTLSVKDAISDITIGVDGTVYAGSGIDGNVYEFAPGNTKPTKTLSGNPYATTDYITITVGNTLYSDVHESALDVVEIFRPPFIRTSRNPHFLPGARGIGTAIRGIVVDRSGNIAIGFRAAITVFPPRGGTPSRAFGRGTSPVSLALGGGDRFLYAADTNAHAVIVYDYRTGSRVDAITSGWGPSNDPYWVAVPPPWAVTNWRAR